MAIDSKREIRPSQKTLSVVLVLGSASHRAGGLYNSVRCTARALATAGHRVTAIAVDDRPTAEELAQWLPIEPRLMPAIGPDRIGFAPGIRGELLANDFDIVHQHGLWQAFSFDVSCWRRRRQRPVMISPRGMLDPWALQSSTWKKRFAATLYERSNLNGAACLHALNSAEAQAMRSFGLKSPIAIIPNGVDLSKPRMIYRKPAWLGDDDRKILLFLGRLHPKKGIRETLDAWSLLRSSAPNISRSWRLVIAGWDDGGYADALAAHAHQLDLLDDVTFPGPIFGQEKEALLQLAEAFILASFSEGLPMAVLEAWSYGLPVFMTNECNLLQGFETEAAIEISTDPSQICATLGHLLGSAKLLEVGQRGRELVEQEFTWEKVVRDLLGVYHWLASGGDHPECVVES